MSLKYQFSHLQLQYDHKTRDLIAQSYIISFLATENLPNVKLGLVEVGSNKAPKSLIKSLGINIWSLLYPLHMKSWPQVTLGQVGVVSKIAQHHSFSL